MVEIERRVQNYTGSGINPVGTVELPALEMTARSECLVECLGIRSEPVQEDWLRIVTDSKAEANFETVVRVAVPVICQPVNWFESGQSE